jgi:hypothetical protein
MQQVLYYVVDDKQLGRKDSKQIYSCGFRAARMTPEIFYRGKDWRLLGPSIFRCVMLHASHHFSFALFLPRGSFPWIFLPDVITPFDWSD